MEYWLGGFLAFTITFLSTPVVISVAKRFGVVDSPNRPHPAVIHKKTVPRAGGVPPLIGFIFALIIISLLSSSFLITKQIFGIIASAILLVLVGVLDDKFDLNPYLRLISNFLIVLIVVGFGLGISWITNPFGGLLRLDQFVYHFSLPSNWPLLAGEHSIVLLADAFAFIWIIWVMNALNWSSGVDGQLTGIAVVALGILGIASSQLVNSDTTQVSTALIAFTASGAFLGFLPWSFYPQKIMPGYGGSTLAGFLIASLAILSGAKLATSLLILLVPLIDSIWAVIRRVSKGHSPVWGDKLHLHHQLLAWGWTIPQICLAYYAIGLGLGLLALNFDTEKKFFAILLLGVIIFAFLITSFIILGKLSLNKNAKSR